jgi:hypothetical protein
MAARDPRFQKDPWKERIRARALEFYAALEAGQDPKGGWGYYEGPVVSHRPTWSTSFATACVIPALIDGKAMGWKIDQGLIDRAASYVRQCRLPTGAYTYDLGPIPRITGGEDINNVKGSLGRIQVAHWALRRGRQEGDGRDPALGTRAVLREPQVPRRGAPDAGPARVLVPERGVLLLLRALPRALVINQLPRPSARPGTRSSGRSS